MNVTSLNTSRADLTSRAENYGQTVASDPTNPYRRGDSAENEFFMGMLDKFEGATLGDIKTNVDSSLKAHQSKAKWATIGGLAMAAAGFLGPGLVGIPSSLGTGLLIGGIVVSQFVGGKAAQQAAVEQKFSQQLADWASAIDGSQAPPAQPPAQPAPPAQPPAQQAAA